MRADFEKTFKMIGSERLHTYNYYNDELSEIRIEDLYQAFKERLAAEKLRGTGIADNIQLDDDGFIINN